MRQILIRASGIVLVGFFLLLTKNTSYAQTPPTARITNISPFPINCRLFTEGPPIITDTTQPKCFSGETSIEKVEFTLIVNIELQDRTDYTLRIHRIGDDINARYGVAPLIRRPDSRTMVFEWDFRGLYRRPSGFTTDPGNALLAASGHWYVDAIYAGDQKEIAIIPSDVNPFTIYESPTGKNPTFRAQHTNYPKGSEVTFEILNPVAGSTYTVWWDGKFSNFDWGGVWDNIRNFDFDRILENKKRWATKRTSDKTGETLSVKLDGLDESGAQKACMAIINAANVFRLTCDDFCTTITYSIQDKITGGPSKRCGRLNADPITGVLPTTPSITRVIPQPKFYTVVHPCGDGGIETGIGCIPTTPSGLITKLLQFAIGIGGGIALLIMAFASIQMMTAQGDPEKLNEGKEKFVGAIAGLLFIIFSVFLLNVIGVQILAIPGFGG